MSIRKSTSGGDSLSFCRSGERTPLRSLQNEILHHSTESHVKTKPVEMVKPTKENALHDDNFHMYLPTSNTPKTVYENTAVETCKPGDITYTSFTCAGGEVEVFSSFLCAEESIVLPLEEAVPSTQEAEDTVFSDSVIVQSIEEHMEHPYYNACIKDYTDASSSGVIHCTKSAELAKEHATEACCDVTWKSFVCDGAELEISDDVTNADDTIPLPRPGLSEFPQEQNLNSSNLTDPSGNCNYKGEKMDHPYCSIVKVDAPTITEPETQHSQQQLNSPTDRLEDITLKCLNCTGGEIELSDSTQHFEITVPLPADQTSLESNNGCMNSTLCTEDHNAEHFDHPYCTTETLHSLHVRDQPSNQEVVYESENSRLKCKEAVSLISSEVELEHANGSIKAEITTFGPEKQSCQQQVSQFLDTNSILQPDQIEESSSECKCAVENGDSVVNVAPPNVCQQHEAKEQVHFETSVFQPRATNIQPLQDKNEDDYRTIENDDAMGNVVPPDVTSTSSNTESIGQQHEAKEEVHFEVSACKQLFQTLHTNIRPLQNQIDDNNFQRKSSIANADEVVSVVSPEVTTPTSNSGESVNEAKKELHFEVGALQQLAQPIDTNITLPQDRNENSSQNMENNDTVVSSVPEDVTSPPSNTDKSLVKQYKSKEELHFDVGALASSQLSSEGSDKTIPSTISDAHEATLNEVHCNNPPSVPSDTKDSALGLSPNAPALSSSQPSQAETLPDVFRALSECPTVASALQFGFLSPVVHRVSLAILQAHRELAAEQFAPNDCGEKSLADFDCSELWKEHLDSPMPRPLFNSTALVQKSLQFALKEKTEVQPCAVPQPKVNKPVLDVPLISDGPLQQQLRQMAEFLLLASGKMGPTLVSSAPIVPTVKPEYNSACVGTTTLKQVNHSVNTSGQFERKRDFAVEDQCTLTDPLLWNVSPDSLRSVPRQELEQRLLSSMIMVEALVQQLASAQAPRQSPAGAAPSELREKLVQTEHTELSQTTMHRDLYLAALDKIKELEMDNVSLQNLVQNMQNVKAIMTFLSSDTDATLGQMKQIEDVVREDHQSLVSNYGQMKSLLGMSRESVTRMMHKVKDTLQQKEDMRSQMEEAFSAKEAAFSVMDQLRKHCSMKISELEKCVRSQKDLLSALNKAHPEQVALNKAYCETLDSASELLSKNIEEQSTLKQDLYTVRGLLRKCTPILLKLSERADAALRDRDEHIAERDKALQEREQIEDELNHANLNLQAAKEQIGDLNLQVTILTSEMGVLRQKLSETEEERGQVDRKATELSATVSSTLASYAFLEQALASETTKLQQSWKDIQQAKDRAEELEESLGRSEQRVSELSHALSHSEEQLGQMQSLSESQASQIQQLQDLCTQLSGVREMNEFLQMENELAREQMSESEHMLRANLQSLRERNIQCEDLNEALGQLQHDNSNLQVELDCLRTKLSTSRVERRENLAQAVTEITLLHHTLRGLTNELQLSLKKEKPDKDLQPAHNLEPRHHSSSFVDSVMVALTAEREEEEEMPVPEVAEPQCGTLFSESSAFTRITAVTPKTSADSDPEEEQSNVSDLLSELDTTVTELGNALTLVQQRKDAQLEDRRNTICRLQRELEAANNSYQTEVSELKYQLNRLNARVEKGNAALQQKAQDDKILSKLLAEISEVQELLNKHKADNNELRKEVVELRRSLKQSKTEAHFLRDEMRKNGDQSANPARVMDEKIDLMKEVERLKTSLQKEEQARIKLLERAKRHQVIYQTNQQKSETELQMLNHVINKVRETLLCLPAVVKNCEQLQALIEYIG